MSRLGYIAGVAVRVGQVVGWFAQGAYAVASGLPKNPVKAIQLLPDLVGSGRKEQIELWPAAEAERTPTQTAQLESLYEGWKQAISKTDLTLRDFSLAPINTGHLIAADRTEVTPKRVFMMLAAQRLTMSADSLLFPEGSGRRGHGGVVRYIMQPGPHGITLSLEGHKPDDSHTLEGALHQSFLPSLRILTKPSSDPERRYEHAHEPDMAFDRLAARAIYEGTLELEDFTYEGKKPNGSASILRGAVGLRVMSAAQDERHNKEIPNPVVVLRDWGQN